MLPRSLIELTSEATIRLRRGLMVPTVVVGALGGLAGAAYVGALHALTAVLGPGDRPGWAQAVVLVAVGGAVALITRLAGESGDVELLVDNIHVMGGAQGVRGLRSLVPTSLLCVASGAAMGPEAPLVQTTGTLGTVVAARSRRPAAEVRILTITGMAAGFTVLFGAPLGSAFFALEILHRRGLQYYEALLPAITGSLCGYVVYLGLSGLGVEPVWRFPAFGTLRIADLALAAAIGLLGALGAALFSSTVALLRRLTAAMGPTTRYLAGGAALGLLAMWSPYALTCGEGQLSHLLGSHLALGALAVAAVAKFAGTAVSLASGWKGGFIIPLFFMGAVVGRIASELAPGADRATLMACTMVALCVAVTKTPVGTTLVVTEMAGLALLPVTLIAAVAAVAASARVTMIETQRPRTPVATPVAGTTPGSGAAA